MSLEKYQFSSALSVSDALSTESDRIAALHSYHILDTAKEADFDELTTLASAICQTPVALITFIDRDRQWFKSAKGTNETGTPVDYSFCKHNMVSPEPIMIVSDAAKDGRFSTNPLVTGEPHIAFYAGVPLVNHEGYALGSLCVLDTQVRDITPEQQTALKVLGKQVMDKLELRRRNIELEQANQKLLKSERRFERLVSHVPVAIATYTGPDMVIEQANKKMLQLWGRTDEVIGRPLLQARPELKGHPYLDVLTKVLLTGKEHTGLGIYGQVLENGMLADGYYDVSYQPIKDLAGTVTGIIVVTSDVTEIVLSRQREEELNEELGAMNEELSASNEEIKESYQQLTLINESLQVSELKSRNLIEQSPVAILTLRGTEYNILSANDTVLKLLGKNKSIIGKTLAIAVPELSTQPFFPILDRVFESGKSFFGYEAKAAFERDGILTDCFVNFVFYPIKGEEGKVIEVMAVGTDVTEQVDARKIAEEASMRSEMALEAGGLGSFDINLHTGAINCNDQCKFNYGLKDKDQFNLSKLFDLIEPEYREYVKETMNESTATGQNYHAEYQIKWPNGTLHWISANGKPLYDSEGMATRLIGVSKDITTIKLFEQQKDDFLSIASHELKTPVTSLKASLQLLNSIKDRPISPLHLKLIEQSNKSMDKMSLLIDDLLNVNRIDAGHLHLEKSEFNIAEMLQECCNDIRILGIYKLIIQGNENLKVNADQHRIEQVVVNLVNNAVKYAPDSSEIFLIIEKLESTVKISVRDTGKGIPQEKLPYLFDRYYRADHSGKSYTGLGLGLFICSEIIKRHGGKIGVKSEIDKGSTFWFTLPL